LFPQDKFFDELADALSERGWHFSDELLPKDIAENLLSQLLEHKNTANMKRAGIGQGRGFQTDKEIRGDSIRWIEPQQATVKEMAFLAWLEQLKTVLNHKLFLGLRGFETHYAFYPPSSGYEKPLDVFAENSDRVLSFVLYLNRDWKAEWGGELYLYNEKNSEDLSVKILPEFGRVAVFLSDRIYHSVNLTKAERFSVTGWLKKTVQTDF